MSVHFQPVKTSWSPEHGHTNLGFDWSDFVRPDGKRNGMRVIKSNKPDKGRRSETPAWLNNNTAVRETLVLFMEERAGLVRCGHKGSPLEGTVRGAREGTLNDRLDRAHATMLERMRPRIEANLTRLCKRWATEPEEKKPRLAILIENADTQLRIIERGAAVFLGVLHHTYRLGMDSVAVAEALSIKPPHVRQILYRLKQAHEILEGIREGRVHVVPHVPHLVRERMRGPKHERVKICVECGADIRGRGNQAKTCGPKCGKKRDIKIKAAYRARRRINARLVEQLKFCSPVCKKEFQEHPLETLKRLGIDLDAVRKEDGDSYAEYVLYCARLNQAPMPAAQWGMITHGARWYGQ